MIPMSLKQRIALAIKGKQNASAQGVSPAPFPTQPLNAPITAPYSNASTKPLYATAEKQLNPGFFKLKKKFSKF